MKHLAIASKKTMLLSIVSVVLILILSQTEQIVQLFRMDSTPMAGTHGELVLSALRSDWIIMALPILSALPCSASFIDDINSGFIKEYLPRTTVRRYITDKIVASIISGGLVLFFGICIAYGISCVMIPFEAPMPDGLEATPYLTHILREAFLFFLSGAFWALVGLTVASLTESRYMAYSSSFIFYYVLTILCERYMKNLYVLYPREWLNPSNPWPFGNFGIIVWVIELCLLMSLLFAYSAKKKIRNL